MGNECSGLWVLRLWVLKVWGRMRQEVLKQVAQRLTDALG